MKRDLLSALAAWMAAGRARVGEIEVRRTEGGGYALCHAEDVERADLEQHGKAEDARALALLDARGAYRPLKTAPNLRRGWLLTVPDLEGLRAALDAFYPAMLGIRYDFQAGHLAAVPLRETLGRQSGMYAVTRRLTDAQAQETIATVCRTDGGCLKKILWPLSPGEPVTSLPEEKFDPEAAGPQEIPLLCHEACNLLVAKAREVVKASGPSK